MTPAQDQSTPALKQETTAPGAGMNVAQPPTVERTGVGACATRAFTVRALLLGLLGCLIIASYTYFNDWGMKQTFLVGNHFPIAIYAALFAFLILVNPALHRLQARLGARKFLRPFSNGEIVVALSMTLVAGSLPNAGLMGCFPQILVMPPYLGKAIPDWQNAQPQKYVEEVNPSLLPTPDEKGIVYDGYVQGLRKGKSVPPLRSTPINVWLQEVVGGIWNHLQTIPFGAWYAPVKSWFPVIIIYFVFIIMMLRIVHRQWSEHEQLSYPIAEFANILLKREPNHFFSSVFHARMFWMAFGAVLVYHIINGWHAYDSRMIEIPLHWNLRGIFWSKLTWLHQSVGPTYLFYSGTLYLTVVGFAYFVPTEISLSLGLSLPLLMLVTSTSYALGHHVTYDEHMMTLYGSYAAMAAVIFFIGRHYYVAVFKAAFRLKATADVDDGAVWACRWFMAAGLAFILGLMSLGLDWVLATLCVLIMGILFLVLARASAETGIPFMQSHVLCKDVAMKLLGPAALGPAAMYILQLVSTTFMMDNRECLSPFVANGLRMGEKNGVRLPALSRVMLLSVVLALFAAGVGVLWVIYDQGAFGDSWMGRSVPQGFAVQISRDVQKLKRTGQLEASTQVSGLSRFTSELREPAPGFWMFFAIGAVLVGCNSLLRLRFVWWPLHSVIFLFWGTWAISNFVWSFLLGWLIKVSVVRFGGGTAYQDFKPLFVGIILGDLCGGVLFMAFGTLSYCWTGSEAVRYSIFPN